MLEKRRGHHGRPAVEARRTPPLNLDLGNLVIEVVPIATLRPNARNARTHSARQIRQIADSICEFGFCNPILLDQDGGVIAGHGRIEAARLLGIQEVPAIRLEGMTEAQKRAYIVADNKLAQNAGWNRELLAAEFKYIAELDIDFDFKITGFEAAEIKVLLHGADSADLDATADDISRGDKAGTPVTRVGDLWIVGEHRMLCGDPSAPQSFERLLGDARADMVFTDPLSNVRVNGHGGRRRAVGNPEFSAALGEMSEPEFTAFLKTVLGHLAGCSINGSIHFICLDWRYCFEVLSAGRAVYSELKDVCVWNTGSAGAGSLYRAGHQLIFVFENGRGPQVNNLKSGRRAHKRTNLWDYPRANLPREGRLGEPPISWGAKPVALVADAILDCSKRGGVVVDCFGGSGTALVAAEKTGRRAYVMELDRACVDLTVRRFEKVTGKKAFDAETGCGFAELEQKRSGKPSVSVEVEDEEDANAG
jgi:hypothetical protein